MSCLAKLFNKILSNRLEKFFETNNIIKKEPIGLMKKSLWPYIYIKNIDRYNENEWSI
jgi:hypothetical protein